MKNLLRPGHCPDDDMTRPMPIMMDTLSAPGRPKILWGEYHFREYTPAELQKWILNPLGLQIVRKKRVRIDHHWSFYFKGIRPFLRLFYGFTWIYEIKKNE